MRGESTLRLLDAAQGQRSKSGGASVLSFTPAVDGRRARARVRQRRSSASSCAGTRTARAKPRSRCVEDFAPAAPGDRRPSSDSALAATTVRPGQCHGGARTRLLRSVVLYAGERPATAAGGHRCRRSGDVPPVADPFKNACGRVPSHARAVCRRISCTAMRRRVSAGLTSCAPRIFVRLSMWGVGADQREKVPMPPPRARTTACRRIRSTARSRRCWSAQERGRGYSAQGDRRASRACSACSRAAMRICARACRRAA